MRAKKVSLDGLSASKTVRYVHDFAGRITRVVYPDGGQARYAYDGAGRLTRVWDAHGNMLAAYTHTAAGNVKTHVVGDGAGEGVATGIYVYNPREWVTDLKLRGQVPLHADLRPRGQRDPAGVPPRDCYRQDRRLRLRRPAPDHGLRSRGRRIAGLRLRPQRQRHAGRDRQQHAHLQLLERVHAQQAGQHHGDGRGDLWLQQERLGHDPGVRTP